MKTVKILLLLILATIIFWGIGYVPETGSMSTLYTVSGIFFSIGLSLIITFDLSPIKNETYLAKIRANLVGLRNDYLKCFSYSTISYLIFTYAEKKRIVPSELLGNNILSDDYRPIVFKALSTDFIPLILNLSLSAQLIAILFFIINFLDTQDFKNALSDKIRSEQEN